MFQNSWIKVFVLFICIIFCNYFPCFFDLCRASLYLVPSICPQIPQRWRSPVKCLASMCRLMSPILSSFPHSLQIRFLSFLFLWPALVGRKFALNSIIYSQFRHPIASFEVCSRRTLLSVGQSESCQVGQSEGCQPFQT